MSALFVFVRILDVLGNPNVSSTILAFTSVLSSMAITMFTLLYNSTTTRALKELELQNSEKSASIEREHQKQLREMELAHEREMEKIEFESSKSMRLLEDKLKCFLELNEAFALTLQGGSNDTKVEKCRKVRSYIFKLRLLAPSISKFATDLDEAMTEKINSIIEDKFDGKEEEKISKDISEAFENIIQEMPKAL